MEELDCVVIGAGVVGLAVAKALAEAGREVMVLEAAGLIGSGLSSRNSEVVHAGIYYPMGSLKARFCVEGKRRLYAYCTERGIGHRRCGKLIVATAPEQVGNLSGLLARAEANGVEGMRLIDRAEMRALEPALRAEAALLSDSSGIVDSHGLMLAYQGDLEAAGGMVALNSAVTGGAAGSEGVVLEAAGMRLRARIVVNAASLHAVAIARSLNGFPEATLPPLALAKGNYFSLSARAPFTRLIYPVPEPGGLGTHLTLDLAGRARFGPDVEWIEAEDYTVDPARGERFYHAIRRYWPDLPDGSLNADYAGIRPKIGQDPAGFADFMIQGPEAHGVPGFWNLFGIESPGLTASLALAAHVGERVAAA